MIELLTIVGIIVAAFLVAAVNVLRSVKARAADGGSK
jgi:hypothetical protein